METIKHTEKESKKNNTKSEVLKRIYEPDFAILSTLTCISLKSHHDSNHKFNRLIRIISNKNFLIQAMANVMQNKGATTEGVDHITSDGASLKLINNISTKLKDKSFKFKPIKRLYIDKTGKNPDINKVALKLYKQNKLTKEKIKELKLRPLGITSFEDKVVQEAIRLVLNAIYEPEFSKIQCNFGFRPNLGVHDLIDKLETEAKGLDIAIEADVQGAFDNVDFQILDNILQRKIGDKNLLKLIQDGLKCGVFYANILESSKLGTTQGSVLSPLLYNIYFHEFDKFICNEFKTYIDNINTEENRSFHPPHQLYSSITNRKSQIKLSTRSDQLKLEFLNSGKESKQFLKKHADYKQKKQKYKMLDKMQKKYPSYAAHKRTIRFKYYRFADDWILFTNASKARTQIFYEILDDWIQQNLKLKLSPTKTLITDLVGYSIEGAKFLGFEFSTQKRFKIAHIDQFIKKRIDPRNKTKIAKIPRQSNFNKSYTQRIGSHSIYIRFDRNRVLNRLAEAQFIKKREGVWKGRSKPPWTTLNPNQIIEKYNEVIRGYLNFYGPVTTSSLDVEYLWYLLSYSCLHTLANKYNTTLRNIIKKYGKAPTITTQTKITILNKDNTHTKKTLEKTTKLIDYKTSKDIIFSARDKLRLNKRKKAQLTPDELIDKNLEQLSTVKVGWRTKAKLDNYCPICGSTENIEMHHVKHVRIGKTTGFLQIMNQLNRKQMPCCKECHKKIHSGLYNHMSLKDLFDAEIVTI
jgi:retron-type reverse transcriptase